METEQTKEVQQSERQIVERITKLKKSYEQATVDSRTAIGEIYSSYMGKIDESVDTPYDKQASIPKLRTEIAYVKPFIFSGDPEVEVEGVGEEDRDISKLYEKIINHRFQTIPNFKEKIEAWVGQAVGFGTSIIKVVWKFQTKKNEDGSETPAQDEPDVDVPNILDVYFNPIISEVKDQPCLIFRSVLPVEDVKNNPAYDYVGMAGVRNADAIEGGSIAVNVYDSGVLMNTDIPNAQQKATSGMVEVFELVDNDRIQTIANDKVLRDVPNKYGFKNAVKFIFEPNIIPNRFEGLGVGQNTSGLGELYFKMFSQATTNAKLGNNPMFMFKRGAVPDRRQLVSKPAGGVEVSGDGPIRDNIEFIQFPDLKAGFIELLNKIDDEHKRASGANDLVQGSASSDTLGQDQIAQANISNRFEVITRRFKACLSEVANMILRMELESLQSPDAEILRIFPQEYREQVFMVLLQSKDDVKYNVKIKGQTNVASNKQIESKRMVELFNIATSVQTATGPLLTNNEMRAMLRRIAERQGEENLDEIIAEQQPEGMQPQIDPMTGQPMQQGTQPMPQAMPNMPPQQVMPQ